MQATIQSIHFDADHSLKSFVQEKVTKLDQFYENILSKEVILKKENSDSDKGSIFEIKLRVPSQTPIATETASTFEEATDKGLDNMVRQLKKFKDKQRTIRV